MSKKEQGEQVGHVSQQDRKVLRRKKPDSFMVKKEVIKKAASAYIS